MLRISTKDFFIWQKFIARWNLKSSSFNLILAYFLERLSKFKCGLFTINYNEFYQLIIITPDKIQVIIRMC